MKTHLLPIMALAAALPLSACGVDKYLGGKAESVNRPLPHDEARIADRGKLTGEGWTILGGDDKEERAAGSGGIGVNSFLWRATLDTLSFMPITQADPFGGTILTDWYEDPKVPGERYKVNATILDTRLRADGVRVAIFKQKLEDGDWRMQEVSSDIPRKLEDTILTRARELRIKQGK